MMTMLQTRTRSLTTMPIAARKTARRMVAHSMSASPAPLKFSER